MSGGAGHVRDMQNRMRQNRAMRSSQKDRFKSNNKNLSYSKGKSHKLNFVEVSDEKLEEIKRDIRVKAKQERRKEIILFLIVCLVIILAIWLLYTIF
jgi:predicted nucleic acid-binding Zn ribbon protein